MGCYDFLRKNVVPTKESTLIMSGSLNFLFIYHFISVIKKNKDVYTLKIPFLQLDLDLAGPKSRTLISKVSLIPLSCIYNMDKKRAIPYTTLSNDGNMVPYNYNLMSGRPSLLFK